MFSADIRLQPISEQPASSCQPDFQVQPGLQVQPISKPLVYRRRSKKIQSQSLQQSADQGQHQFQKRASGSVLLSNSLLNFYLKYNL
ncbi:hypothetical protein V6N13_001410 [Hibiscus sabdariffa]|uniref:Uncharacterized protein n=1 Tax=Hibiscus sabdariffa TaxID=183260 RepID=A0ABR2G8G2_9ROSI